MNIFHKILFKDKLLEKNNSEISALKQANNDLYKKLMYVYKMLSDNDKNQSSTIKDKKFQKDKNRIQS